MKYGVLVPHYGKYCTPERIIQRREIARKSSASIRFWDSIATT